MAHIKMNLCFSVIIPLYNKAPYVRKALESVVAQTYRDFELIIVDDGSTDESLQVVEDYIRETISDERLTIRVIRQKNSGVAAARNRGVKESRGEYVCFLDADDWWEPNFLGEIYKLVTECPDAGILCTNYIYYKPGKTHEALNLPRGYINYPEAYIQCMSMPVTSITTCMPRRVFDEMGGFPVGIKLGEDFLLWAKTAIHYPVAFSEKPLAYYNNDIPAAHRATRNLHAPEHHMLFNLTSLEDEIESRVESRETREDWRALLDWLRVNGMLEYWLDERYRNVAADELKKVNWSLQQKSMKAMYKKPIWYLRAHRSFMQFGSYIKQKLIRKLQRKG